MKPDFKIDSLSNVLLDTSSLDLLRLQKSTWVIGISIWLDVESILKSDNFGCFLFSFLLIERCYFFRLGSSIAQMDLGEQFNERVGGSLD